MDDCIAAEGPLSMQSQKSNRRNTMHSNDNLDSLGESSPLYDVRLLRFISQTRASMLKVLALITIERLSDPAWQHYDDLHDISPLSMTQINGNPCELLLIAWLYPPQ